MHMRKELCDMGDVCDVCQAPLSGLPCVVEEILGEVHTFCSEKCRAEFVKDPSKFHQEEEDVE